MRKGAYWGIRTNVADYGLPDAMNCPFDETIKLAAVATRLKALDATLQEKIINWGYAVCDAALRKHVDGTLPAAVAFPCKNSPKNEERQSYPHRWSNSSPHGTVRSVKL